MLNLAGYYNFSFVILKLSVDASKTPFDPKVAMERDFPPAVNTMRFVTL